MEDEKKAKMGVVECVNHKLIEPFTVLYEKESKLLISVYSCADYEYLGSSLWYHQDTHYLISDCRT